ncbi:MAG: universal stress protein [Rhodocyclaceae bacterium]
MYAKVLLAYDGSESGRSALLECADINHLLNAEIHLLAVAPLMAGLYITEGFVPDTLQEEENRRYSGVLEDGLKMLRSRGCSAEGHLVTGEPVEEICRLAAELACDLIVLGHHRHASLLARWWKGSVGASIIEQAPCSVLIVIRDQERA